jgi:hypothetical protein
METIEKYGKNLFGDFETKLDDIIDNYKNVYGEKIKLINFKHSPSIKMSDCGINYSLEVNWWHIYNDSEIVGKILSMLDKFGDYYCLENYNKIIIHTPPNHF